MSDVVYEMVRNRILELMDQGSLVWHEDFGEIKSPPRSYATGKPYRNANLVLLANAGYRSPYWISASTLHSLGGEVRKNEHPISLFYWKWFEQTDTDPVTSQIAVVDRWASLYHAPLYNYEQTRGLPEKAVPKFTRSQRIGHAEKIVRYYLDNLMGPAIYEDICDPAVIYLYESDEICIPHISNFTGSEEYYASLFHECVHSTGAKWRLNREGIRAMGATQTLYSYEELVAEFGSAYLCCLTGISNDQVIENQAAYIQNWRKYLKNAPIEETMRAATEAQRAVDYMTGYAYEVEPSSTEIHG